MKILVVGGAVRDIVLGRTPHDIDYLVQDATVEEFKEVYPDAQQVGRHFPVFMVDGEEYAFARTERSTGAGHTDFATTINKDVTIMEDLARRDLTINAMAMCSESGQIICSHPRTLSDLKNKILRHNGPAFAEDPLRVFRVARFACQFPDFTVAEETIRLMKRMQHQLSSLPRERVFRELEKALDTNYSHRFFRVLAGAGCLCPWFPEIAALEGVPAGPDTGKHAGEVDTFDHTMKALQRVPLDNKPYAKFAVLCHDLGKALSPEPPKHHGHDKAGLPLVEALCERLRVPNKYRQAALLFTEEHLRMHKIQEMRSGKAVALLIKVNYRMPRGLVAFLKCSMGDGMPLCEAAEILLRAQPVLDLKLPEKYHGRGKACAEILNQLRCEAWK